MIKYIMKVDLSKEQRAKLAQLVVDHIPLDVALKEAAEEWDEDRQKQFVKMDVFEKLCIDSALEQSDNELIAEAKKYAGDKRVEAVLGD